ncbi:hypothetical protein [Pseudoduganella violaceinigra]|uniref:hypothetical protein n=1 Tax=Pseudoduganella violaceinigra TaxID=246602 RepID=UPI0012B58CDD|nr:hypothetical protein [Pseudoduganella violaceinigra]
MKRLNLIWLIVFFLSTKVYAQKIDCSPLDPRAEITTKREAELQLSADTAFKVAKAKGSLKGVFENTIRAHTANANPSDASIIQMRSLYIFCGMVANATDLSTTQKFNFYKELLQLQAAPVKVINQVKPVRPTSSLSPQTFHFYEKYISSSDNTAESGRYMGDTGFDIKGAYVLSGKNLGVRIDSLRVELKGWSSADLTIGISPGCSAARFPDFISQAEVFSVEATPSAVLEIPYEATNRHIDLRIGEDHSVAGLRLVALIRYPLNFTCVESSRFS